MSKSKIHLVLIAGCILFALAQIASHVVENPFDLLEVFEGFASGILVAGAVAQILSHFGILCRLKRWKLRKIGKGGN